MTVNLHLRPFPEHEKLSRAAVKLTDTELTPEAIDANLAMNLRRFSKYLDENILALKNARNHRKGAKGDVRIISDIGFRELGNVGKPTRAFSVGGTPTFQFVAPKAGATTPRDEVPRIIVMHSFGGTFDKLKLAKSRAIKTVAVDPATGFNPARFSNGIREFVVSKKRRVSIHHLVSRRGDLANSASWDLKAIHGGGTVSAAAKFDVNAVSLGIELEEHLIRHGNERTLDKIVNRVPYTEEQYLVVAFILKKYITWTNNSDILKWLGPAASSMSGVKSGDTGMTNHVAFQPKHGDPSAEFLLFQGYRKGDPLPAHFASRRKAYERRYELFFGDVAPGTLISAWDRIFDKVGRVRNFKLSTEVFDQTLAGNRVDVVVPPITGTHVAAAANSASQDRLAQLDRAQRMQNSTRSGIFNRAAINSAAVAVAFAEHTSNLQIANQQAVAKISVIQNALGFNFATAKWVNQDTFNKIKSS